MRQFFQQLNGTVSWVEIMRSKSSGQRYARIETSGDTVRIPVELLGLAAGSDAWMRRIEFKCRDCRVAFPAGEMEGEHCQGCFEKSEQENAVLDGH